jgi:CO/xanthine dehydrogenase Mo-binding subunit
VPHARIKLLDTSAAEAIEGVHAVVSYKNTPAVYYNSSGETLDIFKTERVFDEVVRYIGDRVAAVAADTPEIAAEAVRAIRVEYEPLPANFDPEAGMSEDAYPIHTHGDLSKATSWRSSNRAAGTGNGNASAPHVFEDTFTVPPIHHGAIEPHGAVAFYDAGGKLTVWASSQDSFAVRINLSRIFSLPMSRVRVSVPAMGGAFGGKVDMITEPVAAALSIQSGRPVKLIYTRREDIVSSRTRHAMKIKLRMGFDSDGTILGEDMKVFCNAGAYASGTSNIVWAMCGKFFKVHRCKNIRFTGYPVVTNTPVGGPMRGFGSPQTFFAQQRLMQRAAAALGLDLYDMQVKNLTLPDGVDYRFDLPHGNAHPLDCLKRASELIGYEQCLSEQRASANERYRIGVGLAVGAHGNGMFGIRTDITAMVLKMNRRRKLRSLFRLARNGQRFHYQCKADGFRSAGVPLDMISAVSADTEHTPYQLGDIRAGARSFRPCGPWKYSLTCEKSLLARREHSRKRGLARFSGGSVSVPDGSSVSIGDIVAVCSAQEVYGAHL